MSIAWHEIRDHLMIPSSTLNFQRNFDAIRRNSEPLGSFGDPAALLDALHVGGRASDEKNRLLVALVGVAQSGGETADCALTLMLLALWPGLDAVRRRSIWRRIGTGDEVASEILARASEAIRCLDLQRVNWIAATILRNIERTFSVAPGSGVAITGGFEFDVPVRFDTDALDVTLDLERLGSITTIPLLELRR